MNPPLRDFRDPCTNQTSRRSPTLSLFLSFFLLLERNFAASDNTPKTLDFDRRPIPFINGHLSSELAYSAFSFFLYYYLWSLIFGLFYSPFHRPTFHLEKNNTFHRLYFSSFFLSLSFSKGENLGWESSEVKVRKPRGEIVGATYFFRGVIRKSLVRGGGNLLHRHVGNNEPFRVVGENGTHELSKFHFKLNPIPSTIKSTIFDLRAPTLSLFVAKRKKEIQNVCSSLDRAHDRQTDG